ncbi:hypothetical protein ACVWW1_007287 [Bradyrhizobium sp. JR3.5]
MAYLNAFEKRSFKSGLWLGFAGMLALMTKYWVVTMIGAVGLAALIHPQRMQFLRSPAPWVAIGTMIVTMIPHLVWLEEVNFVPFTYAGDVYALSSRELNVQLVIGYIVHNLGLLAIPTVLGLVALLLGSVPWRPSDVLARIWSGGPNPSVNLPQALNIWIIQLIVAIGAAARRAGVHRLHQDRLGHPSVLPGAACAGCDPLAAFPAHGAVLDHGGVVRGHDRHADRRAQHRHAGNRLQPCRRLDLRRAL